MGFSKGYGGKFGLLVVIRFLWGGKVVVEMFVGKSLGYFFSELWIGSAIWRFGSSGFRIW